MNIQPKTKIILKWHLGIHDGERCHEEVIRYCDDTERLNCIIKEIILKTELVKLHPSNGFIVECGQNNGDVFHKDRWYGKFPVANVKIKHCLKIGNTYYKLEADD